MLYNKFITFEGCDGTGKSTQIKLLYESLKKSQYKVVLTREPGGTDQAEAIRELLKNSNYNWDVDSELLLLMAARNEHIKKFILPNLLNDYFVLSDRYIDSTIAYQGFGLECEIKKIDKVYELISNNLMPYLTIIFDAKPSLSIARAKNRNIVNDKYDSKEELFYHRVNEGYLTIAQQNPERCVIVEADNDIENIHTKILEIVADKFEIDHLLSSY